MITRVKSVGLAVALLVGMSMMPERTWEAMGVRAVAQTGVNLAQKAEADRLLKEGDTQREAGKNEVALPLLEKALKLYQESRDRAGEGQALKSIGAVYLILQQYEKALALFEESLAIAREIKNQDLEARALNNLGLADARLKKIKEAIAYYQQSLAVSRSSQNWAIFEKAMVNLGDLYKQSQKYSEAIAVYQQALPIFQQVKDPNGEARVLNNLGVAYQSLSEYDKAITYYQQALPIYQQLKDRNGEANVLNNLGTAYDSLSQHDKGITYYQQALPIYQQLKDRNGEANVLNNLGVAYNSLSEYDKGITYYQQALPIYQQLKDRDGEASALINLGSAYDSLSQHDKAITYYQQALPLYQQLKDPNGEAKVLNNLGSAYDSLSQHDKAITYYQQALPIHQQVKDPNAEANVLNNLGIAYRLLSQYDKAITYYQQALPIYQQVKDRNGEAGVLNNLGIAYDSLSQYDKAITYYQQALPIYQQVKDRNGEARALNNLGVAYKNLSQYDKAITYYQQALPIYQQVKDRNGEASALNNLGNAYDSLSQYDKAITYYQQALPIFQQLKDRNGEAGVLNNLGIAYKSLSQYDKAITYYQQALPIYQQVKDRNGEAYSLMNLGTAYNLLSQYDKAITYYQQALPIFQQVKDRNAEANVLNNLGNAYKLLSEYDKAITYYQQALPIYQQVKDRNGEGRLLSNLGQLLVIEKQPELAIVFYKQSVTVRETIRTDIRKLPRDSQEAYTQSVAYTYRALADLLLAQGRVLEAQQVLELLKIQELRDYTHDTRSGGTTQGVPLNPPEQPIPGAYNDKISLGDQLTQCEKIKCAQRSQLITQREAANDKFTALVERLKKLLHDQEIKDPAQLQNQEFTRAAQDVILANPNLKTVLIYPLVLDDKLWLVWGSQAGKGAVVFDSKAILVKRKDLSAKVGELQTLLSNRNSNSKDLQKVSQQLYQWLIAPIRPQLDHNGVKQIVFSLDRATRYIPMAVLHDGKQYLIENFAISTILTAKTDTHDQLSANIEDDPVLGLGLTQSVPGFNSLPAVKAELDGIVRTADRPQEANGIYPGLQLFDRDFTETALREKVSDYRILHIATHGQFVSGNPEDSFLVMGDGKKLSIPTIRSITALGNTHLVVLSACETGKGGVDKEGLEVAGIGHYFLLSGAKSVMASLWLVNDPATSLLMRRFYQNLAQGNFSKAQALRQAQLDFLQGKLTAKDSTARTGARRFVEGQPPVDSLAHPYYWAPFILIGNSL